MHVLFVHQSFPAQFGQIAAHLVREKSYRCTFVSQAAGGVVDGIRRIQYRLQGGATEQTHYCSRTFENAVWHAAGVYEALKPLRPGLEPDLIVGHSGFGSTLFLPELFPETPIVSYFEYFYHPHESDLDFRPEWPAPEYDSLRARARNAMIMLDLESCRAGYTPTHFQKGLLPEVYQPKVRVIHDGIDTDLWRRQDLPERRVLGETLDPDTRVVTYVSRGLESMRGFDIFMRAAKRIYEAYPRVVFLVVGSDRVPYGGDLEHIEEASFKEHVLRQDDYDLRRIRFLGRVSPSELVRILSLSDLHIYLTVPFVLSWSLLNAMARRCAVLASDTEPVREAIRHGENGLLCDFFDVDALAGAAVEVLEHPERYLELGRAAEATVRERYSLGVTLPAITAFAEEVVAVAAGGSDEKD